MCNTLFLFFFFKDTATTEIYTLSLHDALPIFRPAEAAVRQAVRCRDEHELVPAPGRERVDELPRSEEHTSELQSRLHLVCRLLLEKKKKASKNQTYQPYIPTLQNGPYVVDVCA